MQFNLETASYGDIISNWIKVKKYVLKYDSDKTIFLN